MALIKCPECQKEISDKAEYCVNCGCPISKLSTKLKCPECNCEIDENTKTCQNCGFPIIKNNKSAPKIQGKVIFQTSNCDLGLCGKFTIKDESGNIVVKLRANDYYEANIEHDTSFYVSRSLIKDKKAVAFANAVNRFFIDTDGFNIFIS